MRSAHDATEVSKNAEIRSGSMVMVRVFGGDRVRRRVVELSDGIAFVCSEQCYARIQDGLDHALPIGFNVTDIEVIHGDE